MILFRQQLLSSKVDKEWALVAFARLCDLGRRAAYTACQWVVSAMQSVVLGWLCLAVSLARGETAGALSFSHILPSQVEALGHINSIVEDRFGLIWIAGDIGLGRFDGYQLRVYLNDPRSRDSLPSHTVTDLLLHETGRIWLTTDLGLVRYNEPSDGFTLFQPDAVNPLSPMNRQLTLKSAGPNGIWLGSAAGLLFFDLQTQTFKVIETDLGKVPPLVSALTVDSQGHLWVGTDAGLMRLNRQSERLERIPLNHPNLLSLDIRALLNSSQDQLWLGTYRGLIAVLDLPNLQPRLIPNLLDHMGDSVWDITEDPAGQIWFGSGAGLNKVQPDLKGIQHFKHTPGDVRSLGNYAVKTLFHDSRGDLWMGFSPSGVDRVNQAASVFQHFYSRPADRNSLAAGGVMSVIEDLQNNLWVGAGKGLNYFNRKTGELSSWQQRFPDSELLGNTVTSLLLDRLGRLWVGSESQGVNRVELASGRVTHFTPRERGGSLHGSEPWSMLEDADGTIWVATEAGLNRLDPGLDQFQKIDLGQQVVEQTGSGDLSIRTLMQDRSGILWLGSDLGLIRYDSKLGDIKFYHHQHGRNSGLAGRSIRALYEDQAGNFWVGTHGGGLSLMDRVAETFKPVGHEFGFGSASVTAITEDDFGHIWFTTLQGAVQFRIAEREFHKFDVESGLLDNFFQRNASIRLRSGELFLGSSKGFSLLDPAQLQRDPHPPKLVFTGLDVLNQPVVIGGFNSPLRRNILSTSRIQLLPHQSVFSLRFSALSYRRPTHSQYTYRLDGFDDQWQPVSRNPQVTYTNLDPGEYVLRVRAANADGLWSDREAVMRIDVLPPWWQTGWAYTVYAAMLIALFAAVAMMQFRRVELIQQKTLNARLRKLDKIKDSFLANTSHELRTPLNGIIGVVDGLLDSETLSPNALHKLTMIKSSGKRLASLVNDILDYAKLTEHSLELRMQPVEIGSVLHEVAHLLRPLAEAKSLLLSVEQHDQYPWVMTDENRLQQILFNLIGNAIKFTDQGRIEVQITRTQDMVRVKVIDTGTGISAEDINRVFLAFHQLDSSSVGEFKEEGTGLGLAITKRLVEMMDGEIGVQSELGKGSCFWFTLRRAASNSTEKPLNKPLEVPRAESAMQALADAISQQPAAASAPILPLIEKPGQYRIMIVDDDPVNRMVLRGMLERQKYQVVEVGGGRRALDIIASGERVDLLLLDIMMPGVDGFAVCETIRERYSIYELPILFLTAHKNDDDLKRGFAVGANEFLTKPVSKYELLALVANHLRLVQINKQLISAHRAG